MIKKKDILELALIVIILIYVVYATYPILQASAKCDTYCKVVYKCSYGELIKWRNCSFEEFEKLALCTNFQYMRNSS